MDYFVSLYDNPPWLYLCIISAVISLLVPVLINWWSSPVRTRCKMIRFHMFDLTMISAIQVKLTNLPPIASGRMLVLGHSLSFYRDPLGLIRRNDWEVRCLHII